MTMTAEEKRVLENCVRQPAAVGTIYYVLKVLANIALKEAAIKEACKPNGDGAS